MLTIKNYKMLVYYFVSCRGGLAIRNCVMPIIFVLDIKWLGTHVELYRE